jgi:MFS family permease
MAGLREMLGSRPLLLAGLCMAGSGVPLALLSSFYPVYLADLGMRPDTIGLLASSRAVTATVSSFAAGIIGARMSGGRGWLLGTVLCGVGIGLTPYLGSFAGLAGAMGLAGLSGGVLQVLSMTITAKASHSGNRAQAMAYTGMYYSVTLSVVPIVMGIVAETVGIRAGFVGLGILWIVLGVALGGAAERISPRAATALSLDHGLGRAASSA